MRHILPGMNTSTSAGAVLLIHCPDKQGIVAAVTSFLHRHQGNITELDQHVDHRINRFFMRVKWELAAFTLSREEISSTFVSELGEPFDMEWHLHFTDKPLRLGIFVSKLSHCLYDILQRYVSSEWNIEIPLIISNHPDLAPIAKRYDIPYHIMPINRENKREQEKQELALLKEADVDLVILARYMQVLTSQMTDQFPDRVINVHHSFLPAFAGARPYHQAYYRGVKLIGATSHFVTEVLDEGPIIAQEVASITHKDDVKDLVRKGRDLEKFVLSQAIWFHHEHRVMRYGNRTIIFQ